MSNGVEVLRKLTRDTTTVPQVESPSFTAAPIGKAIANPQLLDKSAPGGAAKKGSDSTLAAYTKIGSALVLAGVVTWFGVPILAKFTMAIFASIHIMY